MRVFRMPPHLRPSRSINGLSKLPQRTGVYYVISWLSGEVIYVGKANNFRDRWRRHHILPYVIRYPLVRVHYRICFSEQSALRVEARAIEHWKPLLNKVQPRVPYSPLEQLTDWAIDSLAIGLGMTVVIVPVLWQLGWLSPIVGVFNAFRL